MIFVSTIRFSGMPELVMWSEITLDIALHCPVVVVQWLELAPLIW